MAFSDAPSASSTGNLRPSEAESSRERKRRRVDMRNDVGSSSAAAVRRNPEGVGFAAAAPPPVQVNHQPDPLPAVVSSWRLEGIRSVARLSLQIGSSPTEGIPLPAAVATRFHAAPVVGAVAVAGRLRYMEDAVRIETNLCLPTMNRRRPVHFFGVFDGHGGPHVAAVCRERMHSILKEELMKVDYPVVDGSVWFVHQTVLEEAWRIMMTRCFFLTEELVLRSCHCGSIGFRCNCVHRRPSLWSGSTAVAAVLTAEHIVVANCGDSRAVLCRGGLAFPLTSDHKPNRRDERARIEANGGKIVQIDVDRVGGVLSMTRAIGDRFLKPYILSNPEVTFTPRHEEDELLVIATDGLWDVISTQMCCRVARECLRAPAAAAAGGHDQAPAEFPTRTGLAAALLTRLALARGSEDNVSVVVVDLKRVVLPPPFAAAAAAAAAARN